MPSLRACRSPPGSSRSSSRSPSRLRAGPTPRSRSSRSRSAMTESWAGGRERRSSGTTSRPHSALAYVEAHADELGDDPFALDAILERLPAEQFAARSAIDAALHDLCGKLVGLPGLAPARAAPRRAAHFLDDHAQRSGHDGPRGRTGERRPLPAPQAEARRAGRTRRRARAGRAFGRPTSRCRSTSTSTGRWTRRSKRCRRWRKPASSTASSRSRRAIPTARS